MDTNIHLTFYLRKFSELNKSKYSLINLVLSYFSTIADGSFFVHFTIKGLYQHFATLHDKGWSLDGIHKMPYFSQQDIINVLRILDHNKDIVYLDI